VDAEGQITQTLGVGDLGMGPVVIAVTDRIGVTAFVMRLS